MAGRPGFFGGFRTSETPEREGFAFGSDTPEGTPFLRLGDLGNARPFATGSADPVWGDVSSPAPSIDPWDAGDDEGGEVSDTEIFGNGFQISGQIRTGQFSRLSDWLNMQQGFIRIQDASIAHLGSANLPDPDDHKGSMWLRLNQIVLVGQRVSKPGTPRSGMLVQKQKRLVSVVTPGYLLRGYMHVHAHGTMRQFLESPDPHFVPITDVLVRWTSDPRLISRLPFALINRDQLISVLDEPQAADDEALEAPEREIGAA